MRYILAEKGFFFDGRIKYFQALWNQRYWHMAVILALRRLGKAESGGLQTPEELVLHKKSCLKIKPNKPRLSL